MQEFVDLAGGKSIAIFKWHNDFNTSCKTGTSLTNRFTFTIILIVKMIHMRIFSNNTELIILVNFLTS